MKADCQSRSGRFPSCDRIVGSVILWSSASMIAFDRITDSGAGCASYPARATFGGLAPRAACSARRSSTAAAVSGWLKR